MLFPPLSATRRNAGTAGRVGPGMSADTPIDLHALIAESRLGVLATRDAVPGGVAVPVAVIALLCVLVLVRRAVRPAHRSRPVTPTH